MPIQTTTEPQEEKLSTKAILLWGTFSFLALFLLVVVGALVADAVGAFLLPALGIGVGATRLLA